MRLPSGLIRPLNCGEKMDVTLFESHNCDDDNKEFRKFGVCRPKPEMVDGRPSTSQQCRMKRPSPIMQPSVVMPLPRFTVRMIVLYDVNALRSRMK